MSSVNDIRSAFLEYFSNHSHNILSSSPLVPRNDPTLMFTNAGMVQFKNFFTGMEVPPHKRAATSQKCVRAGGKHNDLDNVGYTARHHTFFEMLGNFSFGDYFKEEAISLAWNFITKEFSLPKDKLIVTVYHEDEEAFSLWKSIAGLPDERIIRIATADNFWSMGDTGPCGPCSEIFYDHGSHIEGGPPGSIDADGDRFIEIWNLVFMQFEQLPNGDRVRLPKPSIDTGMGLERISAVLQGKHDNYDIDLFQHIINEIAGIVGGNPKGEHSASFRVIADHLRASCFLVADGVLPSNDGRGYVLRRIMRRGMRHAQILGSKDPLLHLLVPALVKEMGQAYTELSRAQTLIEETLNLEEIRFRKTLERGLSLLEQESASLKSGQQLSGEVAFKLYDTYGFPLDLTQDALRARNIDVDVNVFNDSMEKQKAEARASWTGSGEKADDTIWFMIREQCGSSEFLGYDTESAEAVVASIIQNGEIVDSITSGEAMIVFNQTPFYGESGGQVGDIGVIKGNNFTFEVNNTLRRVGDLYIHCGKIIEGKIEVGTSARLEVNSQNRASIRANHSSTHLLHEALRQVLGDHIAQKGSLVSADRLRFDFSHHAAISGEELTKIEELANNILLQNEPVTTRLMAVDDAISVGARALFGEKYGDEVRVVSMGKDKNDKAYPFSVELCGGTHVNRTGDIGLISIVSESGVAAGVRRIEALTALNALNYLNEEKNKLKRIAASLKSPTDEAEARIHQLIEDRKRLEKELSETRKKLLIGEKTSEEQSEKIGTFSFMTKAVEGVDAKELKAIVDQYKVRLGSGIVVIVSVIEDDKLSIVAGVTDDLISRFSAVDLVRLASEKLGGKGGGGRADLAQAGGTEKANINEAFQIIRDKISANM